MLNVIMERTYKGKTIRRIVTPESYHNVFREQWTIVGYTLKKAAETYTTRHSKNNA